MKYDSLPELANKLDNKLVEAEKLIHEVISENTEIAIKKFNDG
jgi:hypothetical protein